MAIRRVPSRRRDVERGRAERPLADRKAGEKKTSSDKYAWLNKIVAVGVGQLDLSKGWVGYKVYEVG
jgi:uncharacterized protein DUF3237